MGFPTKVQAIKRKGSEQWYINFPSALAQACEFDYGEGVEWIPEDRFTLTLRRTEAERAATVTGQQKKSALDRTLLEVSVPQNAAAQLPRLASRR